MFCRAFLFMALNVVQILIIPLPAILHKKINVAVLFFLTKAVSREEL